MKTLSMLAIGVAGASLTAFVALAPANAATNPVQKQCSDQWAQMKTANKVPTGMTWPKFYSQCAAEAKAAAGTTDTTPAPTKTKTKTKTTKTVATADEGDTGTSGADKKACDAKWGDYKTSSGAHGWKAYFTFMAKCMP